jgi:O-antigen ligase
MFLRSISTEELNFEKSWNLGLKKIKNLSDFDKYITIFWLFGPFIFLIERTPADIWLTFLSIIFLVRCFLKKDWSWANQLWFRLALLFWGFSLFSASISPDPFFSFGQGFVWIRFPLYAATAQVWLAKDRDIRIMMLISLLVGLIVMCLILAFEVILEPKPRLTWPYGDLIPGGYISKVCMPIFIILISLIVSIKSRKYFVGSLISVVSVIFSILTGERTHFILRACSGMLAALFWKPSYKKYFILLLIEILAVFAVFVTMPNKSDRFLTKFANSIPLYNTNTDYWGSWRGGLQQGLSTPIFGIGPSGTRKTCQFLPDHWLPGQNYCGNHPHNFYVQLFAETGLIGLILGASMFLSIISICYKNRKFMRNCPMAQTAFIIPLGMFFPIQQFGSFFGQWGNLFIWISIGFALAQVQNFKVRDK